jgi:hypothetical protein
VEELKEGGVQTSKGWKIPEQSADGCSENVLSFLFLPA